MRSLPHFSERLAELLFENNLTMEQLGRAIGTTDSTVCGWKNAKQNISLSNALKLADYFHCSLEFLTGRSETKIDYLPRACPPFYDRLRQVMAECKITRYRIVKEKTVSENNLYSWKKGGDPFLQSVVDLADYFGCTLDYFLGREK
ncbi:hypothetical protein FACS1894211_00480 [Clostridia bacterium]|nr:hypothetical protein FACS1894211_00480 [Clostridia bacterium]